MNKNKGIIGIGLIVAIVLGVAVVGGGAYYLGKSGYKQNNINSQNVPEINQTQNQETKTVEQTKPVVDSSKNCTQNSTPSIKVISPNGGEIYKAGDKINVKWESCNLSSNIPIQILLVSTIGSWFSSPLSTFELSNDNTMLNTRSAIFTIPDITSSKWTGSKDLKFGNYYKIYVSQNVADGIDASDYSDNSFTINSSSVSTTNWKTYTNSEYGFSFNYPSNWGIPNGSFNGKIFEVYSKESITVPFISYHPSNNKLTMNDFTSNSWGHDSKDIPVQIKIVDQIAYKYTYETSTDGRGKPYPLFNQQVGFEDNKGGFL